DGGKRTGAGAGDNRSRGDLLAQPLRERRRDKARHLVGTAARRKTDDPAHWPRRTDRLAPTQRATSPGARQRPLLDGENCGGEVFLTPPPASHYSVTSYAGANRFSCSFDPNHFAAAKLAPKS